MPDFTLGDVVRQRPDVADKIPLSPHLRTQLDGLLEVTRERVLLGRETQMPVLASVAAGVRDHPFANLRTVMVLHFLGDLLYFIAACEDAGLAPDRTLLLYKPYPYMAKDRVIRCLTAWGYTVGPVENIAALLPAFLMPRDEDILVVEDGGYVVPYLHESLPAVLPRVRGAVEQTMRGLWNDEALVNRGTVLQFPVLSVAESQVKKDFEPSGVAEALWSNIRSLASDVLLRGNPVLIVGFGTIGRALAHHAPAMPRLIYDRQIYRRALARHEGFETVNDLREGLARPSVRLVIGTTGGQSIDAPHLALVQDGTYLASASSDRIEIDVEHLERVCQCEEVGEGCKRYTFADGRRVHLLADGYPVNFYAADSVQNQLIDLIMTQILLCALWVVRNGPNVPDGVDKDTVNRLSAEANLIETFYGAHFR